MSAWKKLMVSYYIWRIRRGYDKRMQAECDIMNGRGESLWFLNKLKPLDPSWHQYYEHMGK
jgi:hypothetical protein